jgi:ABC-type phosphate transport system permease subunit
MNITRRIRRIRRRAAILAGTAAVLVTAGATPAFASLPPDRGGPGAKAVPAAAAPVPVHTVVGGGMPGWQIALIAVGAALLAATLAVLAERARAARRKALAAA